MIKAIFCFLTVATSFVVFCRDADSSVPAPVLHIVIVSNLEKIPLRLSIDKDRSEVFISRRKKVREVTSFGVFTSSRELTEPINFQGKQLKNHFAVNGSIMLDKHPLSLTISEDIAKAEHAYCYVIIKENELKSVKYIVNLKLLIDF